MIQTTQAQFVSEIIEYQPAPGQLINTENFGSPQAALSIIGNPNGLVSLGAFGGYIIVKMDKAIENDVQNPYGVDFSIFGNSITDWCEAGVVQVMKDENNNGVADEEWFVLAGSDYYWSDSFDDYSLTYYNPHDFQSPILWIDHNLDSGYVYNNSIHEQEYYPTAVFFPNIGEEEQSYQTPIIQGHLDFSQAGYVRSYERAFGYADNHGRGIQPYHIPDNPYTILKENAGGDAFDISWARNSQGERVYLDAIHFIKISTAINKNGGHLGEISTEISGIVDVEPNANIYGETKLLVIKDIPGRLLVQSEIPLQALLFEWGIPTENQNMNWEVSNENLAQISEEHILSTLQDGNITISCQSESDPSISSQVHVEIISPSSIEYLQDYSHIHLNENREIGAKIKDQNGNNIEGLRIEWTTSDASIISIENKTDKVIIHAQSLGECYLKARVIDFETCQDSVLIHVLPESEKRKVYITVKNEFQTIIPRQAIWVENFDLNPYLSESDNDYSIGEINEITLAHAIAQIFTEKELATEMAFKDNLPDKGLYLWKIPIAEELSMEYFYGYGGVVQEPFNRAWLIKVNESHWVNKLEEHLISNEDEILVYHCSNINENWFLSQLTSNRDSIAIHENVLIHLKEFEFSFSTSEGIILENERAMPGQNVFLNGIPLLENGEWLLTNAIGQAEISLHEIGNHLLKAGINELQLVVKEATFIEEIETIVFKIYPNPLTSGLLYIEMNHPSDSSILKIYNSTGQLMQQSLFSEYIDVSSYESGLYILQITEEKAQNSQLFIIH